MKFRAKSIFAAGAGLLMILACGFGEDAGCEEVESTLEESASAGLQPGEMSEGTVIDEDGGVAESPDGRAQIQIPAGALTEAVEVVITKDDAPEESPYDFTTPMYHIRGQMAEGYGKSDALEELQKPATFQLEVDAPSGDAQAWIYAPGPSVPHGIVGDSEFDGEHVSAEFATLDSYSYGALVFAMSDECAELENVGTPCEPEGDTCRPDVDMICDCNDGEALVEVTRGGDYCHQGHCLSLPIVACSGFADMGHDGACADHGGWAGDCHLAN